MAENFAIAWGLSHEEVESIRQGAILHDIGKLSVPDAILKKPGPLSAEEWAIMKKHPESARQFLRNMDYLTPACRDIPVYHHERWDGTGYPEGLSGTQIPFAARLFAIVDVWESMIQQRPYKPPIKEETVLEHIKNGAGSHFDPDLAHFFIDNYQYIKSYGDLTPTSSSGYES